MRRRARQNVQPGNLSRPKLLGISKRQLYLGFRASISFPQFLLATFHRQNRSATGTTLFARIGFRPDVSVTELTHKYTNHLPKDAIDWLAIYPPTRNLAQLNRWNPNEP